MSDMASDRITFRLGGTLRRRVEQQAKASGKKPSQFVRDVLHKHLESSPSRESAYAIADRLAVIGSLPGLPIDLSTNKKYFRNFGKPRRK